MRARAADEAAIVAGVVLALGVALAVPARADPRGPPGPTAPPAPEAPTPAPGGPAPAPAAVEGLVLRRGDRLPVAGVEVILDRDLASATTDAEGRFAWPNVPPGPHEVHLRGANIAPGDTKIDLAPGARRKIAFWVEVRERYATTVRGRVEVHDVPVEQKLIADEIKRIPGTQGDTLKAVQNLPGVARAPFGGGLLVVWGSSPQDTRTYVDGVWIPTLYHFGGLRSTVNGEMVQGLNFLPGGYGVDYGRGLGGVIEVQTRRPREDGYHGFLQLDVIDGSLSLEGPITKGLSFAVAARRSWIDVFLPLLSSNAFQLSPKYWDYQAKLRWKPSPRDEAELFLFGSDDGLSLIARGGDAMITGQFELHDYYHRGLARWLRRLGGGASLEVIASAGFDRPTSVEGSFGRTKFSFDVSLVSYNLRASARLPLAAFLRLDAGLDFEGNRWRFEAHLESPDDAVGPGGGGGGIFSGAEVVYSHGIAPWLRGSLTLWRRRLTIVPELRLEILSLHGARTSTHLLPEPRLHLRLHVARWLDLTATVGAYHQAPQAFSLLDGNGNPNLVPQFAVHYVLGAAARPTDTLEIEVAGFYKDMRSLVVSDPDSDPTQVNGGLGRAYGAQLLVRQHLWKGLFGWVAYTLSRAERRERPSVPWHVFQFDQTHILTLIASYKFPRGYQLGVRFRYVTGNPTTPIVGAYQDLHEGRYVPIQGPTLSGRLGDFHQLDLRFDKTWTFERWRLSLYLDIQNLYNARNPEGIAYNYDYSRSQPITSLPFLPAFGTRGDF